MAYPPDVLLPINAKYTGFADSNKAFNVHWDIIWSFTFALTGTEHGFCTFLTINPNLTGAIPGQYLGFQGASAFNYSKSGLLAIAFDSTGYFALSNYGNGGVSLSGVKKNSLIVRNYNNDVIFNECLSTLDTTFFLASATKNYQTLRFRLTSSGKRLYIDYKTSQTLYKTLTTVDIPGFTADSYPLLYTGLTFCSPISSSSTSPSTMFLKNFNYEGLSSVETYETLSSASIYPDTLGYTSISAITDL